jgi:ribosome-associated translation inhibitor RaiA
MQVSIQSSGVHIDGDLETKIQRKLQLALSRVEPYITAISIKLTSDTNAMGRGIHCRITLVIVNQKDIVIEDTQTDLECVIDRVLQKASRTIKRLVFTS